MMVTQEADSKGRTALSALDLPEFFGLDDLIAAVESARATTIEIVEFPGIYPEDGLFGIWLNTDFAASPTTRGSPPRQAASQRSRS
jgi:hypothetical protein